jgi:hypothetical protein
LVGAEPWRGFVDLGAGIPKGDGWLTRLAIK